MSLNASDMSILANTTALITTKTPNNGSWNTINSNKMLPLTQMQIVLYIIMAIIGSLGNTLTITVLLKPKYRDRKSSTLLLNLAVCDTLIAALCIPLDVVYFVNGKWIYGKQLCNIIPPFQTGMPIVSSWTFMFMMLERNSLFIKSIRGQMRRKSIRILVVTTWIISFALVIPYGVRLEATEKDGQILCQEKWADKVGRKLYTVILSVTEFLVPMMIITIFVTRICINLSRQSSLLKRNVLGLNEAKRVSRLRQNRNITKMFIVMIAVYASLKLPNNIFWQWSEFGGSGDPQKKTLIWTFVALAAYSTSMVNPIVLAAMSFEFRREFLDIIKCQLCRNFEPGIFCNSLAQTNDGQDSTEKTASRGTLTFQKSNNIEMQSIIHSSDFLKQMDEIELMPEK